MKSLLTILIAAISILPAAAQQTKLLTADKHNEYGLIYSLPVTALQIEVTARHTVSKSGPFHQYAKRFIGADKVISSDSEYWEVISVNVTPYGVADPDSRYLMQLKPGAVTFIAVDEDGMLLAINENPQPTTTTLKNAGKETTLRQPDINAYLQYVNEDFIASKSSAKQAQMLAESLMEVRDAKISLTRGTAETMPTDGRQLELMLNSLSDQEATMTAAFTGITYTEEESRIFTFTPQANGREVLFRLSDCDGFTTADDLSGKPVYLNVKITAQPELPVDAKGEEKKLPKDAVMYNIPGAALISISAAEKKLWEKELEFAQFGTEFGLNPSLFSAKKGRSYAIFDPTTGALVKLGELPEQQ